MKVSFDEVSIAQLQSCGGNCSRNHQTRLAEEVLVVLPALATKRHYQRRLSATACTSAALRVVRWRGRYVTQMHDIQIAYVHAQFHRWRAKQRGKIASTEACLAILAQLHWNLPGMRSAFDANQSSGRFPIKLREELVRLAFSRVEAIRYHPFRADWIGGQWGAVPEFPLQRASLELNPVLPLLRWHNS